MAIPPGFEVTVAAAVRRALLDIRRSIDNLRRASSLESIVLVNGWTGTLSARRVGGAVWMHGQVDGGAKSSDTLGNLPGFMLPIDAITDDLTIAADGTITSAAAGVVNVSFSWPTREQWE